jgi:hypothetical protein
MAIVVLVVWAFTAGAGFYLLITGNLGRAAQPAAAQRVPSSASSSSAGSAADASSPRAPSKRGARDPWAPSSLVAARQAPVVPGLRSVAEFAHPAGGVIGLGFWLGFTLIHARVLGWIGFGLAAATACMGLAWFTANTRAARQPVPGVPPPSFAGRLVALHGSAAATTIALAALSALLLHG